MALEIKICGLTTPETLEAALGTGADMIGMVFFPPSPRHVDLATAGALAARARGKARIVALSVDAEDAALAEIIAAARPDLLQLHGHESPERVAAIRARFGLPVMKAIGIAEPGDLEALSAFAPAVDSFLLDAKPPPGAATPGGNAAAFDWSLTAGRAIPRPWLLAGGLTPETVARAIRQSGAPAVDVSSGVERARGVKDPARIAAFIAAARRVLKPESA